MPALGERNMDSLPLLKHKPAGMLQSATMNAPKQDSMGRSDEANNTRSSSSSANNNQL